MSSLYLIDRLAFAVNNNLILEAIFLVVFFIGMLYSFWVSLMFSFSVIVGQILAEGRVRSQFRGLLNRINGGAVSFLSTYAFGIDRNDTEHGEVTSDEKNGNAEILARLERLEETIEKAFAQKEIEDMENDPDYFASGDQH